MKRETFASNKKLKYKPPKETWPCGHYQLHENEHDCKADGIVYVRDLKLIDEEN